jgi:hypothetical protein
MSVRLGACLCFRYMARTMEGVQVRSSAAVVSNKGGRFEFLNGWQSQYLKQPENRFAPVLEQCAGRTSPFVAKAQACLRKVVEKPLNDMERMRDHPRHASNTGSADWMALGLGRTPRGGPASIATPAAPRPRSRSICTISPPKECPIKIGASGRDRMCFSKWSTRSLTVSAAIRGSGVAPQRLNGSIHIGPRWYDYCVAVCFKELAEPTPAMRGHPCAMHQQYCL